MILLTLGLFAASVAAAETTSSGVTAPGAQAGVGHVHGGGFSHPTAPQHVLPGQGGPSVNAPEPGSPGAASAPVAAPPHGGIQVYQAPNLVHGGGATPHAPALTHPQAVTAPQSAPQSTAPHTGLFRSALQSPVAPSQNQQQPQPLRLRTEGHGTVGDGGASFKSQEEARLKSLADEKRKHQEKRQANMARLYGGRDPKALAAGSQRRREARRADVQARMANARATARIHAAPPEPVVTASAGPGPEDEMKAHRQMKQTTQGLRMKSEGLKGKSKLRP
jgi:hypothetical protein